MKIKEKYIINKCKLTLKENKLQQMNMKKKSKNTNENTTADNLDLTAFWNKQQLKTIYKTTTL